MQRDVEKVQEIYRAFGKRDLHAVIALMANDVEIQQSAELPWGGSYCGHAGVKDFLAKLSEQLENRLTIEGVIDAGEQVVVSGRTSGKARATGLEFDIPFVHVWTVQEGLITLFEPYIDNATMLVALGL